MKGWDEHPAAVAIMEKVTVSGFVPELVKTLCTGLSVWFSRETGTIPGPPDEFQVKDVDAACDERMKSVAAPEQISGWVAGAAAMSGMGLICME